MTREHELVEGIVSRMAVISDVREGSGKMYLMSE